MILEASFTHICVVYSTSITYNTRNLLSWYVYCTGHWWQCY